MVLLGLLLVVFLLLFIGLYFFIFRNKIAVNKGKRIVKKNDYLIILLNRKIKDLIDKISFISQNNSSYIDQYNVFVKLFNELCEESKNIYAISTKISLYIEQKKYHELRKIIFSNKAFLNNFNEKINNLNDDLDKIFSAEEKQKYIFLEIKKRFSLVEHFFTENRKKLFIFEKKYIFLIKKFKDLSLAFENLLSIGEFKKSDSILNKMGIFVDNLEIFNNMISNVNKPLSEELPIKINIFCNKFDNLLENGHELYDLVFNDICFFKNKIINIFLKIKNFQLENIEDDLKTANDTIDKIYRYLSEEVKARETINNDRVFLEKQIYFLEQAFSNFYNFFTRVSKIYILNEDIVLGLNNIKKMVREVSAVKKNLIFNKKEKICYTFILKKINEVKKKITEAKEAIFLLEKKITFIKYDAEKFYILIYDFYFRVKKIEKLIRDLDLYSISKNYKSKISEIYTFLSEAIKSLNIIPIDTQKIKNNYEFLNLNIDFNINKIEQEISEAFLAEGAIVYLNGCEYVDNDIICKIGDEFFNNEFTQVCQDVKTYIEK